jgi:hypothetical protein
MILELSKHKVELKDELTWWDSQEIQAIEQSGAIIDETGIKGFDATSLLKANIKLAEKGIVKITEGETEIRFTENWVKSLSLSDGEKLFAELQLRKGAKKN